MTGFVLPHRPERAVAPTLHQFYESRGWIAQVKKNGTCSVVAVDDDGGCQFWNRVGEPHRAWHPSESRLPAYFSRYPSSTFVFELLHSKGGGVRDSAYVFDVARWRGESTHRDILSKRLGILSLLDTALGVEIARSHGSRFLELYERLTDPLDEGIVMKNPGAVCEMVKTRVKTKNYSY